MKEWLQYLHMETEFVLGAIALCYFHCIISKIIDQVYLHLHCNLRILLSNGKMMLLVSLCVSLKSLMLCIAYKVLSDILHVTSVG